MERIAIRYNLFVKALASLKEVIEKFQEVEETDYYYKELRDSLIQRFEYSVDALWKLLKDYIEKKYGLEIIASPKAIFKTSSDVKLINDEEYQKCISMVDYRNLTSHAYNGILAEEIANHIPSFYNLMEVIFCRIVL